MSLLWNWKELFDELLSHLNSQKYPKSVFHPMSNPLKNILCQIGLRLGEILYLPATNLKSRARYLISKGQYERENYRKTRSFFCSLGGHWNEDRRVLPVSFKSKVQYPMSNVQCNVLSSNSNVQSAKSNVLCPMLNEIWAFQRRKFQNFCFYGVFKRGALGVLYSKW